MITLYKGIRERNYLTGYTFHPDISPFLYYADSPLKNYEYIDVCKRLNIQVFSGNIDSGINIYSNEEPSALYTSYRVIKPPFFIKIAKVPYYPRYRALNPFQRYEYLQVLINPYRKNITVGYLYLLLYCLERRLSEGQEQVIPIIRKLADFHGGKFKSVAYRTLHRYKLWKQGNLYPQNVRVYANYTLYIGCYEKSN